MVLICSSAIRSAAWWRSRWRGISLPGEKIALLVMIDSYPPIRYAPPMQRFSVWARKAINRARQMLQSTLPEQSDKSLGRVFTPPMLKVQEAARKALADYQPRPYPGKIKFVRAGDPLHFPDDPARVWTKFVEQMVVQTVAGDHQELLTTYYEPLAAVISRYLAETPGEEQTGSLIDEWSREPCRDTECGRS